ncbi:MAG: hypothetical protein WC552_04140 [Candidatus Omnitrophota bacterium]
MDEIISVKPGLLKRLGLRIRGNSGIILLTVLWMLVILTILSVGLGQRAGMEISLTQYALGQLQSRYLGWAGLMYSMKQIDLDAQDAQTSQFDTLYHCAVRLEEGQSPEDVFQRRELGGGYFEIVHTLSQRSWAPPKKNRKIFGFRDEERRINVNALTAQNYLILKNLIVLLGFDEQAAEEVGSAVVDWRDSDQEISVPAGAEDGYYVGLSKPYHCKDRPLDSLEELFLVKGMTEEIFKSIKNYVTIYPKEGNLLVNFDTAPELVIQAVARSVVGGSTNADLSDADSLAAKMIFYRQGEDGQEYTADDRQMTVEELNLNSKEEALLRTMERYRTKVSNHIRVRIEARDERRAGRTDIEAIIYRPDLSLLYWGRSRGD